MAEYITRKCEVYIRAHQAMARVKPHHEEQRTTRSSTWSSSWQAPTVSRRNSYESWATHQPSEAETTETQAAAPVSEPTTEGPEAQARTEDAWSDQAWSDRSWQSSTWSWWQWGWYQDQPWGSWSTGPSTATPSLPDLVPEFVQAWMLLQDAQLDANERNMVLTAVQNDMRLQRVVQELRTQFPESETRRRDTNYPGSTMGCGARTTPAAMRRSRPRRSLWTPAAGMKKIRPYGRRPPRRWKPPGRPFRVPRGPCGWLETNRKR